MPVFGVNDKPVLPIYALQPSDFGRFRGTYRQMAHAMASALRVEIVNDATGDIYLDAPRGTIFAATGTHSVLVLWEPGCGRKEAAWSEAVEFLVYGLTECDEADCEHCTGED